MSSNQNRSPDYIKDTSFNIGTNNVTINIKVDSDEFSLGGAKKNKESDVKESCWGNRQRRSLNHMLEH